MFVPFFLQTFFFYVSPPPPRIRVINKCAPRRNNRNLVAVVRVFRFVFFLILLLLIFLWMNENHYARTHARTHEMHAESNRWTRGGFSQKTWRVPVYLNRRRCAWLYTADSAYGGRSVSRRLRRVDVRPDEHGQWAPGAHLFPDEHYNIISYCKSSSSSYQWRNKLLLLLLCLQAIATADHYNIQWFVTRIL